MQSGNLVIKYSMLLDSTLVASRLTWNKGGEETTKISYYNKEGQDVLEDFTGDSFYNGNLVCSAGKRIG